MRHEVSLILLLYFVSFCSKDAHNPASSKDGSSQSIHPAANESQDFSTPDTRAKTLSEPLPHSTGSSTASSPPSATATNTPSVASKEPASALSSSGHDGNPAALSPQMDCSQRTSGASAAPQKVGISKDEAKDLPQAKCTSTAAEGHKDTKEPYPSKPSSRGNERRSSRDRDRDRVYSSYGRERHYRDRSHERESDSDCHRYRKDYRDGYHRQYRDRFPPPGRYHRDWEAERHRERTFQHPREHDHDRCSNHYHYYRYRSREDADHERRGHGYSHRKESRSSRRWPQESRDSWATKDKNSGKEREYHPSKNETSSPPAAPETNKLKGSPPRARLSSFESVPNKEDQSYARERDDSSEPRPTKKHKKSKKKKKSKDKDRHRESG